MSVSEHPTNITRTKLNKFLSKLYVKLFTLREDTDDYNEIIWLINLMKQLRDENTPEFSYKSRSKR